MASDGEYQVNQLVNLKLTYAKYRETYLGRIGGPTGDETVVTCLRVGNDENDMVDVNLIMDIGDMRALLYNTLRATHHTDPVSAKLYDAFKKVFEEERAEKEKAKVSPDA
jgi:hypothetical protein